MKHARAKRTPYHHGSLRSALVDAAARLAAEKGVAAVTLREAARRAGVTQAAPYHYFRSKSALMAAVAEEGFERLDQVQSAAVAPTERDPQARLTALLGAYLRFAIERPHYFTVMFRSHLVGRAEHPWHSAAATRVIDRLVEAVRAARFAAGHDDLDPVAMATLVWALPHGLASLYLDGPVSMHGATPVLLECLVRAAIDPLISASLHDLDGRDWAV